MYMSNIKYLKYKHKYLTIKNKQIGGSSSITTYSPTLNEIECWLEHLYTKLGWIILCQTHGKQLKVNTYILSIDHLIETIHDRREIICKCNEIYINILYNRAVELQNIAAEKLDFVAGSDITDNLDAMPLTLKCAEKWLEHLYEKLGWMILIKDNNNENKIVVYKNSIQSLINSINKMVETDGDKMDSDMKYDLEMILLKAYKLNDYVVVSL